MACDKIMNPVFALLLATATGACSPTAEQPGSGRGEITISVLGTNDVHGALTARPGFGGLPTFSGYVAALRVARAGDDGVVLLIDAGDMWQGTLESNLSEGESVVAAFNALNYTAAAIGNHEFDFGPAGPASIPKSDADDPRGALKQRATEANFPLLAANLIDTATDRPVDWPNVQPSIMVDAGGIKVGIIGLMTANALAVTIAANTHGLRVAPLVETIINEAHALRKKGATLVIVTAHAGSRCHEFEDPLDLSSCNVSGEIMRVAEALPPGLVDHIIAGHTHAGIAHVVNDISITSSYSSARVFGRVDFKIDRETLTISNREVFPPHRICAFIDGSTEQCATADSNPESTVAAQYEGMSITPDRLVLAIANRVTAQVDEKKREQMGVYLETAITLDGQPESALGHLMTDALLESSDADVAIHNVAGGIRANLPQGELIYGSVFQMFPFDNRLVVLNLSGAELRRIIAHQVRRGNRRAGLSGMRVFVDCDSTRMNIAMRLANGHDIEDGDNVRVAANDFLILGGDDIFTPVTPADGFALPDNMAMVRDVLVNWFGAQGDQIGAEQFLGPNNRRWHLPDSLPDECLFQPG